MTIDYNTQNGSGHIQNVNSMINSFSRFPVSAKYHDIFSQKQTKDDMLQGKKCNNPLCLSDCPSLLFYNRHLEATSTERFLSVGQ